MPTFQAYCKLHLYDAATLSTSQRLTSELKMPDLTAQIIITLDSVGNWRAELPGINGAPRRKVDLIEFTLRNPELHAVMRDELDRREREQFNIKRSAVQAEIDREKKLENYHREREVEWEKSLDSMTHDQRERALRDRAARQERIKKFELEVAHSIWHYNAEHFGTDFANKVQPTERRPSRAIIYGSNGSRKVLNPRTGVETHRTTNGTTRKVNPSMGEDL